MWQVWLILAGIFLIIEIINFGFLIFWFSIGALVAMVSSFFTGNIIVQTTIFLVVSTLLLLTKPFVDKMLPKDKIIKTNAYSIEGKIGKVISDIEPIEGKGQVKVSGEVWSAKSSGDIYISKDTEVLIEKIDGVKVIVKPLV